MLGKCEAVGSLVESASEDWWVVERNGYGLEGKAENVGRKELSCPKAFFHGLNFSSCFQVPALTSLNNGLTGTCEPKKPSPPRVAFHYGVSSQ